MADASFTPPQETTECYCDNPEANTQDFPTERVVNAPNLPVDPPKPNGTGPFPID